MPYDSMLVLMLVVSLAAGSFATMLAHRLPLICMHEWSHLTLWSPRSHCTHCKNTLPWWCLLPLVSFMFLRGRCHMCGARIASYYFWMEMAFFTTPFSLYLIGVSVDVFIVTTILVWWLILLAYIDAHYGILPDELTICGLWLGLFINTGAFGWQGFVALDYAVYGALLGYLLPWAVNWLFVLVRGKQGMGYGDFKMLAMLGAWLGVMDLLFVLMCASLVGVWYILARALIKGISFNAPIAFGVCLSIATLVAIVLRTLVIDWSLLFV